MQIAANDIENKDVFDVFEEVQDLIDASISRRE
jgi:hypothetical protein